MPDFKISIIDWIIILCYFAFIIWRGIGYAKKHANAEDYFLAGRSLTWPIIGLSLYASNISSSSLIGMAASGYETGFSVFSYEWMAAVVLIIFAIFFLPFYLRSKIYTLPEFLEKRFDSRSRYYFSALTVLTNIGVDTAATLYAGALANNPHFGHSVRTLHDSRGIESSRAHRCHSGGAAYFWFGLINGAGICKNRELGSRKGDNTR
jgi:SSS family solute:Na+ symporter